jgi:MFS family permease
MVFAASLAGQVLQGRLTEGASLPLSCMALVAGAGLLAVSMTVGSMTILLCGAVVAGLGQGGIFAASITAVTAVSPNDRKAEVTALLFVVIYLSVALPVLGLGVAVELSGLRTPGIAFAVLVLLLSMGALFALRRRRKRAPVRSRSNHAHIATRNS